MTTIAPLGDAALLVTCAQRPGGEASALVHALVAAVTDAAFPGVRAIVPGYTTVLVHVAPESTDLAALAAAILQLPSDPQPTPPRLWQIPACYDGEDLLDVAAQLRLPPGEVVARHAAVTYTVACLGFAPGFAYLSGLPPELAVPRRATPRPRIAAGSLIVGGQQTAVMPSAMPSGWHVLGHTAIALFDVTRAAPSLLMPGDIVQFQPVARLS